ncbi:hypothetical protein [Sorangium sp. So ce233]
MKPRTGAALALVAALAVPEAGPLASATTADDGRRPRRRKRVT